jgi:uncharacterized integral membrane protein
MLGVCYACQSTAPIGSSSCPKCGISDPYRLASLREVLGVGPIPGLFATAILGAVIVTGVSMVAMNYFGWNPELALWIGGIVFVALLIMGVLSHAREVEARRALVETALARQMTELAGANPTVSVGEATTAISASLRTNKPPAVLVDAIAAAFARRHAAPQQ